MRFDHLPVRVEFKPQDCWIGVFWKSKGFQVDVWVCLIPMLPVHFWFMRRWKGDPSFAGAGSHTYPRPSLAAILAAHDRDRDQPFLLPEALRESHSRGRRWLDSKNPGET